MNKNSQLYLKNKYLPESNSNFVESYGLRKKAKDYFDKFYGKILVNEVLSLKYPSLTDLFIHINMKDLENYYSSSYIDFNGTGMHTRQAIIGRLSAALKKHKNKKILLISHSMGAIITHDTLLEYLNDLRIDTLVSIGSPLGQKYVLRKMLGEQKDNSETKLKVPENIYKYWYNLSDLEDQVALNHLLADIYVPNSKGVKIIDKLVQNNFMDNGIRNPHSSYGYLRTPELAEIVYSFLAHKKFNLFGWLNLFRSNNSL
jgi:pimeloyl-ACP methyl ester carboxylesterase